METMPSSNRLLILAVLALSPSVQSAPSGDAAPPGLSVVNGVTKALAVRAPMDNFEEEGGEELEAREVGYEDEPADDVEARTVDEEGEEDEEDKEEATGTPQRTGPPHSVNTVSPDVGKPFTPKPHKAFRPRALHKPSKSGRPHNINTVSPHVGKPFTPKLHKG